MATRPPSYDPESHEVFIAATTACFPDVPLPDVIDLLIELEFTAVEIAVHDDGEQLTSARIADHFDETLRLVRDTHRLDISAYDAKILVEGEEYYERFTSICRLAKATKVVTVNVPSSPQGTPFNEEIERLQRLVGIGENDGVRVAIRNQIGCISEDPDTVKSLCDYVPGLGLAFDPSHHLCSPTFRGRNVEKLMPHVFNIHLRDSKKDKLQVRVGQGDIEYGRLLSSLQRDGYDRALCVDFRPDGEVDVRQELRKLRLLLESLL